MAYNTIYLMRRSLEDLKASFVFDIGCGVGRYTNSLSSILAPKLLVGVDLKPSDLKIAKSTISQVNSDYVCGDAHTLPFRDKVCDLIFASDMLHHAQSPEKVLLEFKRILKRDERILILEAERNNALMAMWIPLGHNHFTLEQLRRLLRSSRLGIKTTKRLSAYPESWVFWSGRPMEIPWDCAVTIFHVMCSMIPRLNKYLLRLLSISFPPSYNLIIADCTQRITIIDR